MKIFERLMSEPDEDGFSDTIRISFKKERLHIEIRNINSTREEFLCSASLNKEETERFLQSLSMATALL